VNYLIPLYLALVGRVAGTQLKYAGLALYTVPYILAVGGVTHNLLLILLTCAWVFVWKLTGHADGFKDYQRDNFLSPVVKLLPIDRNSTLYDACFFAFKGSLIAALPSVITGNYMLLASSAVGYALAYHLSFKYSNSTILGEAGSGFIAGLGFIS